MRENLFLFRFVIVVIFLVVLFLLARWYRFTKLKRRLARCSVPAVTGGKSHFLDRVDEWFYHLVKKVSSIFQRLSIFRWWGRIYDSYAHGEFLGMDLLAMKWISCVLFLLFYLGIVLFPGKDFSWFIFLFFAGLGFFVPNFFYFFQQKSYEEKIRRDFIKAIVLMHQVASADRTLYQAVSVVVAEFTGPIRQQFQFLLCDLECGLSYLEVGRNFQKRVPLPEVALFAEMLALLEQTKGSLESAFTLLEKQLCRRADFISNLRGIQFVRKQIGLVILGPLTAVSVLCLLFPETYSVLWTTKVGCDLLFLIFLLAGIYLLLLKIFVKEEGGQ